MKRKLFLTLGIALLLTIGSAAAPSDWAAEEVRQAQSAGLVPFYLQNDYQQPITREAFCDLIVQAFSLKAGEAERTFPDTQSRSVTVCASLDIVDGFADGTFHPAEPISREQAAVILRRLHDRTAEPTAAPRVQTVFPDTGDIAPWAEPSVTWCVEAGVMNGTGSGFSPKDTYTREQSILTVLRLKNAAPPEKSPTATLQWRDGTFEKYREKDGTHRRYRFAFSDGTEVVSGRLEGKSPTRVVYSAWVGKDATLRTCEDGVWKTVPLAAGTYEGFCTFVDSAESSLWLYAPQEHQKLEQECLQYRKGMEGWLRVDAAPDGWLLHLYSRAVAEGEVSDYLVTASPAPLIRWSEKTMDFFKDFTMKSNSKWCYDGYYYPAPEGYTPSGPGVMYRNTAAYHVAKLGAVMEQHPGCKYLVTALLHVIDDLFNPNGYIPQENQSGWLREDYDMASGYYDTRWNSDLMEIYLHQYRCTGDARSAQTLETYMAFYMDYAQKHHWETANGGWLVEDYWNTDGGERTHTSLNHQLAELSVILQMAELYEREDWQDTADKLLLGITDCGDDWVREDGDLQYAYLPDGTFGLQDYPYLTYNDLFRVQKLLPQRDEVLQKLMDAKKLWMDAHGVTEYDKEITV